MLLSFPSIMVCRKLLSSQWEAQMGNLLWPLKFLCISDTGHTSISVCVCVYIHTFLQRKVFIHSPLMDISVFTHLWNFTYICILEWIFFINSTDFYNFLNVIFSGYVYLSRHSIWCLLYMFLMYVIHDWPMRIYPNKIENTNVSFCLFSLILWWSFNKVKHVKLMFHILI